MCRYAFVLAVLDLLAIALASTDHIKLEGRASGNLSLAGLVEQTFE